MDTDSKSTNYIEAYVISMYVIFQLHPRIVSEKTFEYFFLEYLHFVN